MQWSRVRKPWIPFDREAVLAYKPAAQRARAMSFSEVEAALIRLMAIYRDSLSKGWRDWKKPSKGGTKVDKLAVDPEGHLVRH